MYNIIPSRKYNKIRLFKSNFNNQFYKNKELFKKYLVPLFLFLRRNNKLLFKINKHKKNEVNNKSKKVKIKNKKIRLSFFLLKLKYKVVNKRFIKKIKIKKNYINNIELYSVKKNYIRGLLNYKNSNKLRIKR
jgi:hypothetical protein